MEGNYIHTLSIILFNLSSSISAFAQPLSLTLPENNLTGPVKSATTKAYWQKEIFGEWENSGFYFGHHFACNIS
ncbi:MAG: hypothetical protein EOP48_05705 [Sphingobacteriales bacterium]|nr:MAG: hypothetical protein EOP48_05705 [Sphingobacteriales bacterium]